ncbi:MAG TPA: addiction module protein [Longimicrobium sp.]|jgi:putative addiction module component (TIGR02574 family)
MNAITISDLMHLSVDERLQLVEDLWDSIAAEAVDTPERLPVAEAQRQEILRRSEAHRINPGEAIPLEEALERIERSLG